MDAHGTRALERLCERRFQSFSEATDAALAALEEALPGAVALAQLDEQGSACRILAARGDEIAGIGAGAVLPLLELAPPGGAVPRGAAAVDLDESYLRSLGVNACLSAPLELTSGGIVGEVCAFAQRPGAYDAQAKALLDVAARLLGHEWESVQQRAELRRARAELASGPRDDADTGLPGRDGFLDLLEREWRLVRRGTLEAMLFVARVDAGPKTDPALETLALKDAAEVLATTARATDHVGRVGERTLAVVLVGCDAAGAGSFLARVEDAVARVTASRPVTVALAAAVEPLDGSPSALEALSRAERTVAPAAAVLQGDAAR